MPLPHRAMKLSMTIGTDQITLCYFSKDSFFAPTFVQCNLRHGNDLRLWVSVMKVKCGWMRFSTSTRLANLKIAHKLLDFCPTNCLLRNLLALILLIPTSPVQTQLLGICLLPSLSCHTPNITQRRESCQVPRLRHSKCSA